MSLHSPFFFKGYRRPRSHKINFENRENGIINFLINQLLAVPLMPRPVICALLTKTIA
jgi:hypothetical protein